MHFFLFCILAAAGVDAWNNPCTRPCFSNQPEADVTGTRAGDDAGRELLVALAAGVAGFSVG